MSRKTSTRGSGGSGLTVGEGDGGSVASGVGAGVVGVGVAVGEAAGAVAVGEGVGEAVGAVAVGEGVGEEVMAVGVGVGEGGRILDKEGSRLVVVDLQAAAREEYARLLCDRDLD